MAQIAYIDLARLVSDAGFPGGGPQATAIAVISAESGRNPEATNVQGNTPPSVDRGLWQINSYWHSEVSDACAFDPVCSTKEALRISKGGTSFAAWSAFANGSYLKYLDAAKVALDGLARVRKLEEQVKNRDTTVSLLSQQVLQLKLNVENVQALLRLEQAKAADLKRQLDLAKGDDAEMAKRLEVAESEVERLKALAQSHVATLENAKLALDQLHREEKRLIFG